MNNRRIFLKQAAVVTTGAVLGLSLLNALDAKAAILEAKAKGPFKLPKLPYAYDALEPHIDKKTMEIHYTGHHQAYTDALNDAVAKTPAEKQPIEMIFKNIKKYNDAIRNNAGGYWNHEFFWNTLSPKPTVLIGGLDTAIRKKWNSLDAFKADFNRQATQIFGAGWCWLIYDRAKKDVFITTTANQNNPLMEMPGVQVGAPIIGLDVWEHAYYLKHQNKRADYIAAFWNLVNWNEAEKRFQEASAPIGKK